MPSIWELFGQALNINMQPISFPPHSHAAYRLRGLLAMQAEGLVPILQQILATADYDCRQSESLQLLKKAATKSPQAQHAFHTLLVGYMDKWLISPRWLSLFQQLTNRVYNINDGRRPKPKTRKLG